MRQNEQVLRDWIGVLREKLIDSESVMNDHDKWLFDRTTPDTVIETLDLLFNIDSYIIRISHMKSELLQARLQDESNPSQTVKMIIEKFERGEKIDGTDEHI